MFFQQALLAQKPIKPVLPLYQERGQLFYNADSLGNRIPDFSYCGYMASEKSIPMVPVKVIVPFVKGDATLRIQAAIDYVSSLPLDANGFRGAVLLQKGIYEVGGQLLIPASGIVLRGSSAQAGTTLLGTGKDRQTLIRIEGKNDLKELLSISVKDNYVPVNAIQLRVDVNNHTPKVGDKIIIKRPSTKEWIQTLGAQIFGGGIDALGWKPGEYDLHFYRTITAINADTIFIDAPITTALDKTYGGASIAFFEWNGQLQHVGVENLSCVSAYDKTNLKDEDHRWNAIDINHTKDAWVRQVNFKYFAGSAVNILETSSRITIEDCMATLPISEPAGQRRYTFFTTGQQTLFQRCYSENGYHDFAAGYTANGPNAFVQCESVNPISFSGAIDSWASGLLFDIVNVDGNALRFSNRGQDANGAGWAAANSVFWNCTAAKIDCYKPPTAQNWSFGSWAQFSGDGYWGESNNTITPRSLYYAQLAARLHKNVDALAQIGYMPGDASSSPSVETAMELTREASKPRKPLQTWIREAAVRNPIATASNGIKTIDQIGFKKEDNIQPISSTKIKNGWLINTDKIITGARQSVQWWSGGLHGKALQTAKPHITRFVPGKTGTGFTDDLTEVTNNMKASGIVAMEHNYGLWYDRRRDDHQRVRRMDAEAWPPFYELPFARSGKETAWDGLSKYDLNRYNYFYWSRLKTFADLADQKGLLLIHQQYFQHNIIEAGAHFADFPWRTANNINQTGFIEPVNYAGDKRIFYAEQFYDVTHPARAALHKKYIQQCLTNFKNNNSVIHLIGEEFTGPLSFVQFWLDVIKDWRKQNGVKQIIGLSTTKDVQDAILNNPIYAAQVDLIDIRYWHYQADGTLYAPKGGQNLAPRQHARLLKPKKTSFEQVYRAVKEYKEKFPSKVVTYSGDNYNEFGMAVFMAGGSLPLLRNNIDSNILSLAVGMKPTTSSIPNEYILTDGKQKIVYNSDTKKITIQ